MPNMTVNQFPERGVVRNNYSYPYSPDVQPALGADMGESVIAGVRYSKLDLDRASAWRSIEVLWDKAWFGGECWEIFFFKQNQARRARLSSGSGVQSSVQYLGETSIPYQHDSWQQPNVQGTLMSQTPNQTGAMHKNGGLDKRSIPLPANNRAVGAEMDNHMPAGGEAFSVKLVSNTGNGQLQIQHQQGKAQEGDASEPNVGTWANRQFRMFHAQDEPGPASEEESPSGSLQPKQPSAGTLVAEALRLHQQQLEEESQLNMNEADDVVADAAWKWRFARRWHAEQMRPLDGEGSLTQDHMEDAIQFINAGGGAGWNMQVSSARTDSMELGSKNNSLINTMLLGDDDSATSRQGSRALHGNLLGEATKEVNARNSRAAKLMQQQLELEREAENRWKNSACFSGGEDWIGNRLEAVEVDDWGGPFRFILIKVMGRNGKQQIIVRGRNYSSESTLVEEASRSMVALAAKCGLPMESMHVMGGGLMEWSRDGERLLCLHSGYVSVSECRHHTTQPSEILNLAFVLAKQSLPLNTKFRIISGKV